MKQLRDYSGQANSVGNSSLVTMLRASGDLRYTLSRFVEVLAERDLGSAQSLYSTRSGVKVKNAEECYKVRYAMLRGMPRSCSHSRHADTASGTQRRGDDDAALVTDFEPAKTYLADPPLR